MICVDVEALQELADRIGATVGRLEYERQEFISVRRQLTEAIEADSQVAAHLDNINRRMSNLHGRMNRIPQFLRETANEYVNAENQVDNAFKELIKKTEPAFKAITEGSATGAKTAKDGTDAPWWKGIGDFFVQNQKAIIIAAAAVALIAVGIATCGAGDVVLAPALAAALGMGAIGAGTGLATEEVFDYADDGKVDNSYRSYAGTAADGFVTGAFIPVGGTAAVGAKEIAIQAAKNGAASMAGNVLNQEITNGKTDVRQVAFAGATAAVMTTGLYGVPALKNMLKKVGGDAAKGAGETAQNGEFLITNWETYPDDLPRPDGPFRLVNGTEYDAARNEANQANQALHAANPSLKGLQIHEIQPVKFGGSPTDITNKIPLTPSEHARATTWWRLLQRELEKRN